MALRSIVTSLLISMAFASLVNAGWTFVKDQPCFHKAELKRTTCGGDYKNRFRCDGTHWVLEETCPERCEKYPGKLEETKCIAGKPVKGFDEGPEWGCDPAKDNKRCDGNQPFYWTCEERKDIPGQYEWSGVTKCDDEEICIDHNEDGTRLMGYYGLNLDQTGVLCRAK